MAEITSIQFYRGTAAAWTSANPTLAAGKPGFETDTGKLKIGDGTTAWNSLPYINGSSTNGLTTTSGTTKLGGALIENTTITGEDKSLAFGTDASPLSKLDVKIDGDVMDDTAIVNIITGSNPASPPNHAFNQFAAQASTTDGQTALTQIHAESGNGVPGESVSSDLQVGSSSAFGTDVSYVSLSAENAANDEIRLTVQAGVSTRTIVVTGGNLVMSSNKITGLGAATANGDAVIYEQVIQDFTTLVDGTTVAWDLDNKQSPIAKLTSTQSFTLDLSNVKSGSIGMLKIITNTASAITISFDAGFTHKTLNNAFTTYTLPAGTAKEYFLQFVVDGTLIEWVIADGASSSQAVPFVNLERIANQSTSNGIYTPVQWDTEVTDNSSVWASGDNTKIYNPYTGDCIATVYAQISFASNSAGLRRVGVGLNGVLESYLQNNANSATITVVSGTIIAEMAAGDYIDIQAYQNAGTLNVTGKCRVMFHPL